MEASPAEALRAIPAPAKTLVDALLEAADREGAALHLVGGPVRDWLLGRPIRDVDLLLEVDGTGSRRSQFENAAGRRCDLRSGIK